MTQTPLPKDSRAFWIHTVGIVRGDLSQEEIRAWLQTKPRLSVQSSPKPQAPAPAPKTMDYRAMCEVLACELEAALAEVTRHGDPTHLDTEGYEEYRTLHPRQDS